jgi:hypothetical protein
MPHSANTKLKTRQKSLSTYEYRPYRWFEDIRDIERYKHLLRTKLRDSKNWKKPTNPTLFLVRDFPNSCSGLGSESRKKIFCLPWNESNLQNTSDNWFIEIFDIAVDSPWKMLTFGRKTFCGSGVPDGDNWKVLWKKVIFGSVLSPHPNIRKKSQYAGKT